MKKVLFVSDTTKNLFNGVQIIVENIKKNLLTKNIDVIHISLDNFNYFIPFFFKDFPCTFSKTKYFINFIKKTRADYIHIFTEGILGLSAKKACKKLEIPFTSSYHTHFDLYLKKRYAIPSIMTRTYLKYFHKDAKIIVVPSSNVVEKLENWFPKKEIKIIPSGIDHEVFYCHNISRSINKKNPIFLYFGRIAKEKNIDAFLKLSLKGQKWVVGTGPYLKKLKKKFSNATYFGYQTPQQLAILLNQIDVVVFPSKTDTFGMSIIEVLACGVPVAAFPVHGPKDILTSTAVGSMNQDLNKAIESCLSLNRQNCIEFAKQFSWDITSDEHLKIFAKID